MLPVRSFTKKQVLTLIVFSVADFCNAICVSLQAPFYPQEAEKKGATAAEYGLVFGVFELVVFLVSPIYGHQLHRIGPKLMFNGGILTTGVCAIIFGLLDHIEGHYPFIILSFVIRSIEAMGNAAFLTASFAIIASEFPEHISTTFASLETFFGLGLIVGPTVGGALYQLGGYQLPFMVLGSMLFASALMTYFVLPDFSNREINDKCRGNLWDALRVPGVCLAASNIVITSASIGFLSATLEPHLRQFHLSPLVLGAVFIINGGMYAMTAPLMGWIVDNYVRPKTVALVGCLLLIVSFQIIGPAPYVPSPPESSPQLLQMVIVGLVLHGLSIAALLVSSFTAAMQDAVAHGFPNNMDTYGLISGLWTATFALGAFIGPTVAGLLYQTIGFRNSTIFVTIIAAFVAVLLVVFLAYSNPKMYTEVLPDGSTENLVKRSLAGSQSGLSEYGMGSSQSIACAPGMSGYITGNSYRNRLGELHRRQSDAYTPPNFYQHNSSYGSTEQHWVNGYRSACESVG